MTSPRPQRPSGYSIEPFWFPTSYIQQTKQDGISLSLSAIPIIVTRLPATTQQSLCVCMYIYIYIYTGMVKLKKGCQLALHVSLHPQIVVVGWLGGGGMWLLG